MDWLSILSVKISRTHYWCFVLTIFFSLYKLLQLTKSLSSCYLCAKLIFINIILHQFLFFLLLLSVSLNIFLVQIFSVMFNDFLMKARHFIKTSCKQKVKTFFRSTLITLNVKWVPHLILR